MVVDSPMLSWGLPWNSLTEQFPAVMESPGERSNPCQSVN